LKALIKIRVEGAACSEDIVGPLVGINNAIVPAFVAHTSIIYQWDDSIIAIRKGTFDSVVAGPS
jgi:hypothetical protein